MVMFRMRGEIYPHPSFFFFSFALSFCLWWIGCIFACTITGEQEYVYLMWICANALLLCTEHSPTIFSGA